MLRHGPALPPWVGARTATSTRPRSSPADRSGEAIRTQNWHFKFILLMRVPHDRYPATTDGTGSRLAGSSAAPADMGGRLLGRRCALGRCRAGAGRYPSPAGRHSRSVICGLRNGSETAHRPPFASGSSRRTSTPAAKRFLPAFTKSVGPTRRRRPWAHFRINRHICLYIFFVTSRKNQTRICSMSTTSDPTFGCLRKKSEALDMKTN